MKLPLKILRWLEEDKSGMAVVDVKMVSGFTADEESLERVRTQVSQYRFVSFRGKSIEYISQ